MAGSLLQKAQKDLDQAVQRRVRVCHGHRVGNSGEAALACESSKDGLEQPARDPN